MNARKLGADWDEIERGWWINLSNVDEFYSYWPEAVPSRYRPDCRPPYVLSDMIPRNTWYVNLRSAMTKEGWYRLRQKVYDKAGNRCQVCGGKGSRWSVECDEQWAFIEPGYDGVGTQLLRCLTALCPDCHSLRHLGYSSVVGRLPQALEHMAYINRWTDEKCKNYETEAFGQWARRSSMTWQFDIESIKAVLRPFGVDSSEVKFQQFAGHFIPQIANHSQDISTLEPTKQHETKAEVESPIEVLNPVEKSNSWRLLGLVVSVMVVCVLTVAIGMVLLQSSTPTVRTATPVAPALQPLDPALVRNIQEAAEDWHGKVTKVGRRLELDTLPESVQAMDEYHQLMDEADKYERPRRTLNVVRGWARRGIKGKKALRRLRARVKGLRKAREHR
ncbi:MAG: hypothetical protein KTR25_18595 [Myxococcales bacterium]|nr:hypothetical protein [Myxococcales bacterium]